MVTICLGTGQCVQSTTDVWDTLLGWYAAIMRYQSRGAPFFADVPLHGGVMGPFYLVFETSELSAEFRYTTILPNLCKIARSHVIRKQLDAARSGL